MTAATPALIALGSNLQQPVRQVAAALARLAHWPGISELRCSHLYRTRPWGRVDQPDFINAVVFARYRGNAIDLLSSLLAIEREFGRVRDRKRWGPRVLDLDLLDFGGSTLACEHLTLPHPRMAERAFVLLPLAELAPSLRLFDGSTAGERAATVDREGISRLTMESGPAAG